MTLLNKLTIKNLQLNKKRTIVTIFGILLSVALLTAVSSMFFSARESLIEFQKREQGNYHFGFEDVSREDLEELALNRKIENIYVMEHLGYAKLSESKNEYKPYAYVKALSADSLKNMAINLVEGRLPENEQEILVPSHLKTNGGVKWKVGETISLAIGKRISDGSELTQSNPYIPEEEEEITDTRVREYKIVGIMERFPYRLESYEAPGYTFITYLEHPEDGKKLDAYVRYTKAGLLEYPRTTAQILNVDEEAFVKWYDSEAMLKVSEEEFAALQAKVGKARWQWVCNDYLVSLESGTLNDNTLQALASAALIVIVIIIATSVFCIKNSFDISITEKIRQYGMLASIGATKKQIKRNVYYEAMILGAFGIPLGILSGLFAARVLIWICNLLLKGSLEFELVFCFSFLAVLFAVVLGLVTILLSARKSANKASKIAPIQAIRDSDEIRIRPKKMKSPKWVRGIFGIGGEISYKNLQRSRKKYRTTVVSIVTCVSVFIGLSSFINLAFDTIQAEFRSEDYTLEVRCQYGEGFEEKREEIRSLPEVKRFSAMAGGVLKLDTTPEDYTDEYRKMFPEAGKDYTDEEGNSHEWEETLLAYVLERKSFQEYAEELGLDYGKVRDKGILINTVIQSSYDEEKNRYVETETEAYVWKTGDIIQGRVTAYGETEMATGEKEEEQTIPVSITLATVTDKTPLGVSDYRGNAVLILGDAYRELLVPAEHREYLYMDSDDTGKVQEEVEKILENYDKTVTNIAENVEMMRSFYTLIAIFLYGFIAVIALIGVTNIFNTITTNMNLRRREFAMLKSIGMTKREFQRMIWLESFFYGMKSLLIGIPIGIVLSYWIYKVMMGGVLVLSYMPPIKAIVISVVAVFALIALIMRYSIGRIQKQNIIETIRNENI